MTEEEQDDSCKMLREQAAGTWTAGKQKEQRCVSKKGKPGTKPGTRIKGLFTGEPVSRQIHWGGCSRAGTGGVLKDFCLWWSHGSGQLPEQWDAAVFERTGFRALWGAEYRRQLSRRTRQVTMRGTGGRPGGCRRG